MTSDDSFTMSVAEAHQKFGDLAKIVRGVTHWMKVETHLGVWRPMFDDTGILLLYYQYHPTSPNHGVAIGDFRLRF